MTVFTVSATDTAAKTLKGGDILSVTADGVLRPAGPAVRWDLSGTGVTTIDNAGRIAPTSGRAIDTVGSAGGAQTLILTNRSDATISAVSDLIRVQSSLNGGGIGIDNAGTLAGGTGRGINVQDYAGLANFSLLNAAGANFTATGDVIRLTAANAGTVFNGTFLIDNAGTIRSTGTGSNNGQALDLNDLVATEAGHIQITNRAGGVLEAADADAVRTGSFARVDNSGMIQSRNASAASSGNDGIDLQANVSVAIYNYAGAQVIGARHGITGENAFFLFNAGAITGQQGGGLNLDTPGTSLVTVVNDTGGVITGTATAMTDGDGIDVDGLVDITNRGTIRALGIYGDGLNEALAIGGGRVENSGTIASSQRAITVDDSNLGAAFGALTLVNSGTITGGNGEAIAIAGDFADTIANSGTIAGSVSLGSGDDTVTLTGDGRVDFVDGGAGRDTVTVSGAFAGFSLVAAADGTLTLADTNAVDGDHGTARFAGVERLVFDDQAVTVATGAGTLVGSAGTDVLYGSDASDRLLGMAGDDRLLGGAGDDVLDGRDGADRMTGGVGNDSYIVDSAGDVVVETAGGGTDTVKTTLAAYTLGGDVEALQFLGPDGATGTGNALANTLFGGAGGDTLSGLAGDDRLVGGAGDDVLVGGGGRDSLEGGAGADRFVFADGDFGTLAKADIIRDFDANGSDVIDLSALGPLAFVGGAAFSGTAPELRYQQVGANTFVYGDSDGDGVADFAIQLDGARVLDAADFVLA